MVILIGLNINVKYIWYGKTQRKDTALNRANKEAKMATAVGDTYMKLLFLLIISVISHEIN